MAEDHIRVLFELKRGEDVYPPTDTEGLWAEPLGNNLFKIDNVPFFVKGISCEDVAEAQPDSNGELRYKSLVRPSARNTLRVIVFRESPDQRPLEQRVTDLRLQLEEAGCSTELSHMPGLIAVDTDSRSINTALGVLRSGEKADLWEYEEGAVRA